MIIQRREGERERLNKRSENIDREGLRWAQREIERERRDLEKKEKLRRR